MTLSSFVMIFNSFNDVKTDSSRALRFIEKKIMKKRKKEEKKKEKSSKKILSKYFISKKN
jgi:hypothetical protein